MSYFWSCKAVPNFLPLQDVRIYLCLTAAIVIGASTASGQTYPSKPVRLISPGTGATELVARIVAQGLADRLGQQFFVELRVGAGGNIGAEAAAKSPADGYTLFLATQPHTVNVSLYKSLSYDFIRDFAPITRLTASPLVVVVHPSLPVQSIADLVRLAKAKPGAVDYASTGIGTSTHLAAELFGVMASVNLAHIPYKGGAFAETALISGETPLYFGPVATLLPFIKSGRLRAIAVTTAQRQPGLPQTPTVADAGYPNFEYANWHGLVAPAKTARETIIILNTAAAAVLKQPDVARRFEDLGLTPVSNQPEAFAEFIRADTERWRKIVQQRGIRVE